ncbi:hypothetical protein [Anaeromusa acidaminophila]|uniref:hypothetical protein n=1 Tax=Anaeromusa acidaminophila TaxID=81464 RepID=UPI000374F504|nr:hypothetical protein [Anaeromusa acidaminophila]
MNDLRLYFSDFFGVDEDVVESYGAVNISLINDLPLFIDPFLLFNSEKEQYQEIHREIISYLLFLQMQAEKYPEAPAGMMSSWYIFSEVKQTWLGFSLDGNSGRGLGKDFALNLHKGLQTVFKDFGKEKITRSPHLEKLCLISHLVGRDKISDFTTNFAKQYLLKYTSDFATEYLDASQCKKFNVPKVEFNYDTMTWKAKEYLLPCFNDDYVLLTPRDLLTRDDTFINRTDMVRNLRNIASTVENDSLRFELNNYFMDVLSKKKKEMSQTEKDKAAARLILENPELIDYYIKYKEDNEATATSISKQVVEQVKQLFNTQLQELVKLLVDRTDFYKAEVDSRQEAYNRVMFLKSVIEDMDGYRIFYLSGKPLKRESDLQVMYRLVWFASEMDVNREVNNGRGPVDFKISKGSANATLVEFKLASNSKLKNNLAKQVEVYKKANCTERAIKVILYFSDDEYKKVSAVLTELGLQSCKDIVLIDASNNKPSASNVTI